MGDVVLGADLGTSGLKVVALGDDGRVVAEVERAYEPARPRPGWAQIDVRVWLTAFGDAVGRVVGGLRGSAVRGLGLAGQMHGAVLVDGAGAALGPALLWPDQRAAGQLARWRSLPTGDRAALANPLVAGMTGPLLAWLADSEPDRVARAAAVLLPKDALRSALLSGGPAVTDRSDASATLLWDVPGERWSTAAVAAAGVRSALMPEVRPSDEVTGTVSLGRSDVPVVVGGADTPLAALAAGTRSGLQVNLGSGAQVLRPVDRPRPVLDALVHTYADVDDGWYAMAALQNGGSALDWAARMLAMTPEDFFAAAAEARPGAGGVVFRPFLTGERGGVAGPAERAAWREMSAGTTRGELARAAVEGVVFAVAAAVELVGAPEDGEPVVLTGGAGRSALVRQLVADVLNRPVRHVPLRSASAIGAALLAARAVGLTVAPPAPAPVVQPRPAPGLEEARERWGAFR